MSKTVVGLFGTMAQAEQVKQALVSNGYEGQNIHVVANNDANASASSSASTTTGTGAAGVGEKIGSYFRNLTGGDEAAHHHFATGVNQGGALLAVTVADEKAYEAAQMLKQQGARDIEGGSRQAASTGSYEGERTELTGETMIPIVEEQLVVGKREVDHGGVRIYSHVTERPADAEVMLREERINVERRPVDRPATAADFQAGSGAVIELNAMAEEAVVGKSSRVVEEVRLGKQSSEHAESIHDTVRKTEVDVEKVAAETSASGTYGNDLEATRTKKSY